MPNPLMTPLFNDVFLPEVLAFSADRSIDFTLDKASGRLTQPQIDFLVDRLGSCVSGLVTIHQVHGDRIVVADTHASPGLAADGVITRHKGVPLTIRTADCLPVFLFDPVVGAIGLVHAGWKGSREEIAKKAVARMDEEFGTNPGDIRAAFGPAIGPCCYEVGKEFKEYFPEDVTERQGRFFLDLPGVNKRQLLAAGLKEENVMKAGPCTACNPQWFSYRREGIAAGRMISVMMLKSGKKF